MWLFPLKQQMSTGLVVSFILLSCLMSFALPQRVSAISSGSCHVQSDTTPSTNIDTVADTGATTVYYDFWDASDANFDSYNKLVMSWDPTNFTVSNVLSGGSFVTSSSINNTTGTLTLNFPTFGIGFGSAHTFWMDVTPVHTFSPTNLTWLGSNTSTGGAELNVPCVTSPTTQVKTVSAGVSIPSAPALSGTPGSSQNNLSWTASTGATGYTLKRGSTTVYTGTALTFTDTGVVNNTAYSYTVTASNTAGTSANSNTVTLTPSYSYLSSDNNTTALTEAQFHLIVHNYAVKGISLGLAVLLAIALILPFRWRSTYE